MSDPTPYKKLGVTEDASFEEVKDARDRLMVELDGDELQQEMIEAAYDAILMDRLRARQEGKIKVPDRIRFPEKTATTLPTSFQPVSPQTKPNWLTRLIDNPSRREVLNSLGAFVTIGLLNYIIPTATNIWLSFALLVSIYFLRIKENKFGRSVLLAFAGLILGVAVASCLNFIPGFATLQQVANYISMTVALVIMWLVTAFLR